jgi:DNA-binding NarL/FixJ family response regulator
LNKPSAASPVKTDGGPISILIVDDHPVLRSGLEAMLRCESDMTIHASTCCCREALDACRHLMPDLVLLDMRMPEMDGFLTLAALRRLHPRIRVILLAGVPLRHEADRAREQGAQGYLSKGLEHEALLQAIRYVHGGGEAFMQHPVRSRERVQGLSQRELEVLECLSRGLSREDIATALHISAETVKSHVKSILTKLEARDRAEAVARAFEKGLLQF